jgi:predicted transcriptional regulator
MTDLKAARKAAGGISQIQLAREAGVSRFRIYLFEAGVLELRPDEIKAITDALRPGMERAQRVVAEFQGDPAVATGGSL